MGGALSLVAVALRGECQLAIGRHLVGLVLQQAWHVRVGDAVMVAAEADVILFQFNGPEGRVELAVLVLPVGVHASDEAQQQQHHQDDDGQDNDVELRPGHFGQRCGSVVGGAAQAGQQRLGGGGGAERRARVAAGRGSRGGGQSGAGGGGGRGGGRCARCGDLCRGCICQYGKKPGCWGEEALKTLVNIQRF